MPLVLKVTAGWVTAVFVLSKFLEEYLLEILLSEFTAVSVLDGFPPPALPWSTRFVVVGLVFVEDLPLCTSSLCSLGHLAVAAGPVHDLLWAEFLLSELAAGFVTAGSAF